MRQQQALRAERMVAQTGRAPPDSGSSSRRRHSPGQEQEQEHSHYESSPVAPPSPELHATADGGDGGDGVAAASAPSVRSDVWLQRRAEVAALLARGRERGLSGMEQATEACGGGLEGELERLSGMLGSWAVL